MVMDHFFLWFGHVAADLMQDLMSLGIVLHETPELHSQVLKLAS